MTQFKIYYQGISILSIFSAAYVSMLLAAKVNLNLFISSGDFLNNIWLIENNFGNLSKGPVYVLYRPFFSGFLAPESYLLVIWSLVPSVLVIIYFMLIDTFKLKYLVRLVLHFIAVPLIIYLVFFKYAFYSLGIPTGHLLFQSSASVMFALSMVVKSSKIRIIYLIIAISLHFSAIFYIAIALIVKKGLKDNLFISFFKLSKRALVFKFYLISALILLVGIFLFLSAKFRGIDSSYTLGVTDDLVTVMYTTIVLSLATLLAYKIYTDVIVNQKNIETLGIIKLFIRTVVTITFFSLIVSFFHLGLGYRINYIGFVLSPLLISLNVTFFILIIANMISSGPRKIHFQAQRKLSDANSGGLRPLDRATQARCWAITAR